MWWIFANADSIAHVTDANSQPTSYSYDAFGDMTLANPPGPAVLHFTYDLRGRKLSAADPDMGTWTYAYDAFGALYQQTDAKGQVSTMAYDALGRLLSRSEPDMVSNWTYGASLSHHNIDKLLTATCTGSACGSGYTRSYLYDTLARQSRVTIAVNALSYYTNTIYDTETGKVGQVRNFSGFVLDYAYTPRGYLSTIRDDATGLAYFTANSRDASLQLTQSTTGNGVVSHADYDPLTGRIVDIYAGPNQSIAHLSYDFDTSGNLTARGDMLHSQTETFGYDQLNRLTSTVLTGQTRTMRYNSAGSITEKSDVCAANNCFVYSATQVHALSSITGGTVNGVANPSFTYDTDGNMTSGAGRTAVYTSFNMIAAATEGTTNLSLLYDPEHSRIQQTAPEGTTYYLNDPASGAMTERVFPTTGSSVWRNYILADGKIVAERSVKGTNVTLRYFVLDHLGSTVALTNETGALVETDAYDPWGKARDATTGADDTTCSKPGQAFSTRGYTGHEEMPDLCLVNMNARIYDPTIGRFMSPDDVVQDAYNGQNYNRYTYVDDNPLSYTDPTGHICGGCHFDDMTSVGHNAKSSQNNCIDCRRDFDTAADQRDIISHASSVGLNDPGAGQSPSGLPKNMTSITTANVAAAAGDSSPSIDDPVTSSPQARLATAVAGANAGGGEFDVAKSGDSMGVAGYFAEAMATDSFGFTSGPDDFLKRANCDCNRRLPDQIHAGFLNLRHALEENGDADGVARLAHWDIAYVDEDRPFIYGATIYKTQTTDIYASAMRLNQIEINFLMAHEFAHLLPENYKYAQGLTDAQILLYTINHNEPWERMANRQASGILHVPVPDKFADYGTGKH